MLTLLVFASLLLHVLTFIAIRTLQSKVMQQGNQFQEEKKAYETMLSSILKELREENERLLDAEPTQTPAQYSVKKKNTQAEAVQEAVEDVMPETDYAPPEPTEEEDNVSMSNLARVLQLHDQGTAPTDIAKQLGMGKTEVELILLMKKNGEKSGKS